MGVNGINEMIRNFTKDKLRHHAPKWGHAFAERLLDRARAHVGVSGPDRPSVQPGSHAGRGNDLPFAKEDARSASRASAGRHEDMPYYTNSSQLPVGFTDDPFEALDAAGRVCSAGTPVAPCCICT
jgi:hypothetical protein